ncbi:unnamed protein product [Ectocarpus sp. 8 AP-2014]
MFPEPGYVFQSISSCLLRLYTSVSPVQTTHRHFLRYLQSVAETMPNLQYTTQWCLIFPRQPTRSRGQPKGLTKPTPGGSMEHERSQSHQDDITGLETPRESAMRNN